MSKKNTRQQLIDENLLSYKESISVSERNLHIVEDYAAGKTLGQISKKYGICAQRVRTIIVTYIIHCHWYIKGVNGESN